MSRVSWILGNSVALFAQVCVAASPGPPARKNTPSAAGSPSSAGMTTTFSSIDLPPASDRSSGTVSDPQTASLPSDDEHPAGTGRSQDRTTGAQGATRHLSPWGGDLAGAYVNRLTNVSAVSATSCQPWSIVREWPRLGIFSISVTPGLRFCRLKAAFAIAQGTV